MPNPTGVNGHGVKNPPSDDVLRASLLKYREQKQTQVQKLQSLKQDHGYDIKLWKLNKEENRLQIPSKRRFKPPEEEVRQAVIDAVEKDLARGNGPDFIQDQLQHKNDLHVGRDLVTKIMKEHFGKDFEKRFPGRKPIRQIRTQLNSVGPYREVNGDGHEKLGVLALKMGDIGFAIYGYKDKWSDNILFLVLVPESRTAAAGGHLFLDFAEKISGIPIQLTTDKGPEVGYQHAFMVTLRSVYSELDDVTFPPHVILKSTHNTPIEGFWHWFSDKSGKNIKEVLLRGKTESLFYWIFVPLLQKELDDFQHYWNNHRIRNQEKKLMPSGHIPSFALEYPSQLNGIDCRIEIPKEAVTQLREFLEEDTGMSRDECFRWYSDEFAQTALTTWESIGQPAINLSNAWDVFAQMAPLIMQT